MKGEQSSREPIGSNRLRSVRPQLQSCGQFCDIMTQFTYFNDLLKPTTALILFNQSHHDVYKFKLTQL